VQTVRGYVIRAQQLRARSIALIGTQAVRSAANGHELVAAIQQGTALPLHVVDPAIEARLGFLGTTLDLPDQRPRLIVDIGGGSTQLTLVDAQDQTHFDHSLPIGSVALPTQFLRHDPPTKGDRERMELAVLQAVGVVSQRASEREVAPEHGILVGGVGRRLRRAGRLATAEPLVRLWIERLADVAMSVSAAAMEVFGAARFEDADTVRAGAVILREVMNAYELQYCLVSSNGIREGAVLALAREESDAFGR